MSTTSKQVFLPASINQDVVREAANLTTVRNLYLSYDRGTELTDVDKKVLRDLKDNAQVIIRNYKMQEEFEATTRPSNAYMHHPLIKDVKSSAQSVLVYIEQMEI